MTDERLPIELVLPGSWVDLDDQDEAWKVQRLFMDLHSTFLEAAISVVKFEESRESAPSKATLAQASARQRERSRRLSREYQSEHPIEGLSRPERDEVRRGETLWVLRRSLEEMAREGRLPRSLTEKLPFIFAKSFIYSIDTAGRLLWVTRKTVLPDLKGLDGSARHRFEEAHERFQDQFGQARLIRNSLQHSEDRGRGMARGNVPLDLKPVSNPAVQAPEGVLILGSLRNRMFGATTAEGSLEELEVSFGSLSRFRDCIEMVGGAFTWTGQPTVIPIPA